MALWSEDKRRYTQRVNVSKKWYHDSDIAELRATNTLLKVLRDNAGENKSKDIVDFLESLGIESSQHAHQ